MKYIFSAAIAAITISLSTAYAAAPDTTATNSTDAMTALFGDPVIAKGAGLTVKQSDLDQQVTAIKAQAAGRGEEISAEQLTGLKARILEQIIDLKLLLQQANAADKADGTKKADEAMAMLLKNSGSKEALDMQLKLLGSTEEQFRTQAEQSATARAALERLLGVNVTPDEIQKFYDDHPADFEQPEMVHVRHILLMTIDPTTHTPLPDDVVKKKRQEADDVLIRARSGEDFGKLAAEYSDDTMTKNNGGELPPFPRGQMLPEFEAAAFSLTNNEISGVVTTMYGYHIIKFIDKTPAKKLTLSDMVPSTQETISNRIKDVLEGQKTQELAPAYLDKLQKAADVQIVDPDLSQAVEMLSNTNAAPTAGATPAEK